MSFLNKLLLLELQIWISFIWQYIIKIFINVRYLCLSLILLITLVYLEIFPKTITLKLIFILIFLGFNTYFFIRNGRDIRSNYSIKMTRVRQLFQNELGLENHELFSINDTLNNTKVQNIKKQEYWIKFISTIKNRVNKKYSFKLRYFFLNDRILDKYTKISLVGWIILSYLILDHNFYNNFENSISFENQNQIPTVDYSMNVLIYPPDKSKNEIIYLDRKYNEDMSEKKTFLLEKNSKVLMNFYNLKRKDIKIKIKNKDKVKLLKNIKIIDSSSFQFEDLIEDGEYVILLKNKIFQKFTLKIDKKPMINFFEKPKINDDFKLLFNYELIDENNFLTLIELSKTSKNLKVEKKINKDLYNKTNTKTANYIILADKIDEQKSNRYTFEKDIRYLPTSGGDVYLRLISFDKNEQFGTSNVNKIYLPKKIFLNDIAKEIIKIRESVFNGLKIKKIIKKLEKENILNHSLEVKQIISSLIYYVKRNEISYNEKQEVIVNGLWRVANLIEANSIDKILKNIESLKSEIQDLLDLGVEGDKLSEKLNQLEKLINKYKSLKKEKTQPREGLLGEEPAKKEEGLDNKIQNLNDRAKDLLEQVENLLNKKDSRINNNILREIQKLYLRQEKLIDDTYSKKTLSNEQRRDLFLKQEEVFDSFTALGKELVEVLSSERIFIKKIEESFIQILESFDMEDPNVLLEKEIDILNNLKELYNKIKKKSDTNKINEEGKNNKSNQRNFSDENNFDTPIIFESNSFKRIIETIRKMTNDENRQKKEKEYLKRLLPNF